MSRNVRVTTGKVIDGQVVVQQQFCDSCLTVAYDLVGEDVDAQEQLIATAPEVLAPHLCDRVEEPELEIRCDCPEHRS